jgi:hypothetical protein
MGKGGNSHQRAVAKIHSDLVGAPQKALKDEPKDNFGPLLFTVVLAIAPAVVPMPALWKWMIWLICWIVCVYLVGTARMTSATPVRMRLLVGTAAVLLFPAATFSTARSQWKGEMAARTSGDLVSPLIPLHKGRPAPREGTYDHPLVYVGAELLCLCGFRPDEDPKTHSLINNVDSNLFIWEEDRRFHVSTQVRDEQGNLIVEIVDNH